MLTRHTASELIPDVSVRLCPEGGPLGAPARAVRDICARPPVSSDASFACASVAGTTYTGQGAIATSTSPLPHPEVVPTNQSPLPGP